MECKSQHCLSFSHYRIGHLVDLKRKPRFDCKVIYAKSTCICSICNFNDTNPARSLSDQELVQRRSQSLCLSHLSSREHVLALLFFRPLISCAKVGRCEISLYKDCFFRAFMVLHLQPIECPINIY
jgi:hypothetical protein